MIPAVYRRALADEEYGVGRGDEKERTDVGSAVHCPLRHGASPTTIMTATPTTIIATATVTFSAWWSIAPATLRFTRWNHPSACCLCTSATPIVVRTSVRSSSIVPAEHNWIQPRDAAAQRAAPESQQLLPRVNHSVGTYCCAQAKERRRP